MGGILSSSCVCAFGRRRIGRSRLLLDSCAFVSLLGLSRLSSIFLGAHSIRFGVAGSALLCVLNISSLILLLLVIRCGLFRGCIVFVSGRLGRVAKQLLGSLRCIAARGGVGVGEGEIAFRNGDELATLIGDRNCQSLDVCVVAHSSFGPLVLGHIECIGTHLRECHGAKRGISRLAIFRIRNGCGVILKLDRAGLYRIDCCRVSRAHGEGECLARLAVTTVQGLGHLDRRVGLLIQLCRNERVGEGQRSIRRRAGRGAQRAVTVVLNVDRDGLGGLGVVGDAVSGAGLGNGVVIGARLRVGDGAEGDGAAVGVRVGVGRGLRHRGTLIRRQCKGELAREVCGREALRDGHDLLHRDVRGGLGRLVGVGDGGAGRVGRRRNQRAVALVLDLDGDGDVAGAGPASTEAILRDGVGVGAGCAVGDRTEGDAAGGGERRGGRLGQRGVALGCEGERQGLALGPCGTGKSLGHGDGGLAARVIGVVEGDAGLGAHGSREAALAVVLDGHGDGLAGLGVVGDASDIAGLAHGVGVGTGLVIGDRAEGDGGAVLVHRTAHDGGGRSIAVGGHADVVAPLLGALHALGHGDVLRDREARGGGLDIVGVGEADANLGAHGGAQGAVLVVDDGDGDGLASGVGVVGDASDIAGLAHGVGVGAGLVERELAERDRGVVLVDRAVHGLRLRSATLSVHGDVIAPLLGALKASRHVEGLLDREARGDGIDVVRVGEEDKSVVVHNCGQGAIAVVGDDDIDIVGIGAVGDASDSAGLGHGVGVGARLGEGEHTDRRARGSLGDGRLHFVSYGSTVNRLRGDGVSPVLGTLEGFVELNFLLDRDRNADLANLIRVGEGDGRLIRARRSGQRAVAVVNDGNGDGLASLCCGVVGDAVDLAGLGHGVGVGAGLVVGDGAEGDGTAVLVRVGVARGRGHRRAVDSGQRDGVLAGDVRSVEAFLYREDLLHGEAGSGGLDAVRVGEGDARCRLDGSGQLAGAIVHDGDGNGLASGVGVVGDASDIAGLAHGVGVGTGHREGEVTEGHGVGGVGDRAGHGLGLGSTVVGGHVDGIAPGGRTSQTVRNGDGLLHREARGDRSGRVLVRNGDAVRGIAGDGLRIAGRNSGLVGSIDDRGAVLVLGQVPPSVGPLVALVEGHRVARSNAVGGQLDGNGRRADLAGVVGVIPDLGHLDGSDLGRMGVGDGAVVLGGAAGGGVAVDGGLGHLVLDLLAVVEARQAGVFDGVGAVAVVGDGGRLAFDLRQEGQLLGKLFSRQTHAVLVVGIIPDLGDLEVGELVVVGEGNDVAGVGRLDGARGGLATREAGVLVGAARQLGLVEGEASGQIALGEGVGGAGGQVGEAEVPASLHLDGDGSAAGDVVVARGAGSDQTSTGDGCIHDCRAGVGVIDREPDVVVGVGVARATARSLGVVDREGEREGGVLRRVLAGDDLGQVEVGATVVVRVKAGGRGAVGVVGVGRPVSALDLVSRGTRRRGVRVVDHREHGQRAVDEHRVHDRRDELPVVLLGAELGKGEVVALSAGEHLAVLDDARRDVDVLGGPCRGVIRAQGDLVELAVVHEDGHLDGADRASVELVLPLLGHRHRGRVGTDGIGVVVRNGPLVSCGASVVPVKRGGGVGAQRVGAVFVVDDVLLNLRVEIGVQDVAVLQLGDGVIGELAGVAVEGDGVLHAVIKDAKRGEVPLDRAVHELSGRRSRGIGARPLDAIAVVLEGVGVDLEQLNNAGRSGHLVGGAILNLDGADARLLDLGENRGKGVLEVCGVGSREIVGSGSSCFGGQRLHAADVAVGADGVEVVCANSTCKRPRIVNGFVIATPYVLRRNILAVAIHA